MSAEDVLARIRDFAAARKIKPSALAKMAGLHANALRDMHRDDWSPRFDTIRKLEAVMAGKSVETPPPPKRKRAA